MANILISHRSYDNLLAEKLARDIAAKGHHVWLDLWELEIGDSLIQKICTGLEDADYVILCYSSQGVNTSWMGREWMSTLARQLEGHGVILLPTLLAMGAIPAILADIKYADLTKDWNEGIKQLLKAML